MPAGELRRKDREMSTEDSVALLNRALVCRVATVSPDGAPYVLPLNFAYDSASRSLLIHCATSGQLLDNLAANNRVCLEVDEPGDVISVGDHACDTSQVYSSVICFGRARIISDHAEKHAALHALVHKYVDGLMPDWRYDPEMTTIDSTVAIVVQIDTMTGKRRSAPRAVTSDE